LAGLFAWALVSAMTSFDLRGRFGDFVSARKIPFPESAAPILPKASQ
jgi:hypothetical protein